jgi:hypothetical protein
VRTAFVNVHMHPAVLHGGGAGCSSSSAVAWGIFSQEID